MLVQGFIWFGASTFTVLALNPLLNWSSFFCSSSLHSTLYKLQSLKLRFSSHSTETQYRIKWLTFMQIINMYSHLKFLSWVSFEIFERSVWQNTFIVLFQRDPRKITSTEVIQTFIVPFQRSYCSNSKKWRAQGWSSNEQGDTLTRWIRTSGQLGFEPTKALWKGYI